MQHAMLLAEQVTKHARSSWLGLIGFLAFAGVTLLGVEDKDFFAYGVETELPLIGVSIPTSSFFWIAPILATALYVHLHLYLLKLWKIVFSLPERIDGEPLGTRLWPWLVTDWALARRGNQEAHLPLRTIQWLLTVGLVWLAGPLVLLGFWWRSMVKHDWLLTSALGVLLVLGLYVGRAGWVFARKRPARVKETGTDLKRAAVFVLMALPVLWISVERTTLGTLPKLVRVERAVGPEDVALWRRVARALKISLAKADLTDAQLSVKPADWLDRKFARLDFLKRYRERQGLQAGTELEGEEQKRFEAEWRERREEYLSHVKAPVLKGADLRGARFAGAFLAGADLSDANLERADLTEAHLEGADLDRAHLEGANLDRAFLKGTDLTEAHLQGAVLIGAHLEGADLDEAHLKGAYLTGAHLEGASLAGAHLEGAELTWAHLEGAKLFLAHLEGAYLRNADLEGADLRGTYLVGAVLWGADLHDAKHWTQKQLEGAIGDEGTTLPDSDWLTIASCWIKYPELPKGVPRPPWWDDAGFQKRALCGEGEEPRRLPSQD